MIMCEVREIFKKNVNKWERKSINIIKEKYKIVINHLKVKKKNQKEKHDVSAK